MNQASHSPVGFFDSGMGGISVLREAVRQLPHENFIYFGDSYNAPYGIKSHEEVLQLSKKATSLLLRQGAKAIVIACNTATGAAANTLRRIYPQLPIIGIEPAVKPAVLRHPGGRIVVMATPRALQEEKLLRLLAQFDDKAEVFRLPCGGLMEFVERGELDGNRLNRYLHQRFDPLFDRPVDAVVLGCTHYPFLKKAIAKVAGPQAEIIDGNAGTVRELKRRLQCENLLSDSDQPGQVVFQNSSPDPVYIARSEMLFHLPE